MCYAEKCCYFIPLNLACIILGVVNFIASTSIMITSLVYYFEEPQKAGLKEQPHFVARIIGLDLKMETVNIILGIAVLVSLLWMIVSALLVRGVVKNQPSLLLAYFSYSIILTILGHLSGLLSLLNNCWLLAATFFIPSLINIHFLVVVYTTYELMHKGTNFGFQRHYDQDEDPLGDCFDETLENN